MVSRIDQRPGDITIQRTSSRSSSAKTRTPLHLPSAQLYLGQQHCHEEEGEDENIAPSFLSDGTGTDPLGYSSPTALSAVSKLSASASSHRSGSPNDSQPLIVFDWDDTMLASSWIQVRELLSAECYDDIPEQARRDLGRLEQSVIKCLINARGLGTVIIITNAECGWVELSASKFFVNLLPLLEGVTVISARSLFEGQFPGSPLCWKSAAFAYMMHDHFLDRPRWAQKKVVSIGDSNEEKVAMRIASGQHSAMFAKAIKFITGPDPEALACQLDFVTRELHSIVSSDSDLDLVLDPNTVSGSCSLPLHSRGAYEDDHPPGCDDSASAGGDALVEPHHFHCQQSGASVPAPTTQQPAPAAAAAPAAKTSSMVYEDSDNEVLKERAEDDGANASMHKCATEPEGRPVGTPSYPIPIPGQSGAEGGGDCVQPFPASPADVGGASSRCVDGAATITQAPSAKHGVTSAGAGGTRSEAGDASGGCVCQAGGASCEGSKQVVNRARKGTCEATLGAVAMAPAAAPGERCVAAGGVPSFVKAAGRRAEGTTTIDTAPRTNHAYVGAGDVGGCVSLSGGRCMGQEDMVKPAPMA